MAFQPDQEYRTVIAGVSQTEDNDGHPELHLHIGEGSASVPYKLKWKTKDEVIRSRDALLALGVDTKKMTSASYVEGLGAMLTGKEVFIRTKAWEFNGRTGVFIKQLSPTPFEPISKAISGKITRLLASEGALPTSPQAPAPVDDGDVPF